MKIKVPSRWREDFSWSRDPKSDWQNVEAKAEFSLGIGPCGKEVTELNLFWNGRNRDQLEIRQFHSDGTSKIFYYAASQITGRVEIEYEKMA